MKTDNKCPKCGGLFEVGVLPDKSYAAVDEQTWAVKIKNKILIPTYEGERKVKTYRCTSCGYLESYTD